MIVYVEDVNDEAPVFTQQQYNRLGLRETAGIGTSVIVVRATDRDTGKAVRWAGVLCLRVALQLPKGFCYSWTPGSHTQAQEVLLGCYSLPFQMPRPERIGVWGVIQPLMGRGEWNALPVQIGHPRTQQPNVSL